MRMEQVADKTAKGDGVAFVKGCPVCEHRDPELERDLEDFARMLFDIMLADQKKRRGDRQSGDIDNAF
jgi:hypothetical protein